MTLNGNVLGAPHARRRAACGLGALVFGLAALAAAPAAAETRSFAYQVAWSHMTLAEASISHSERDGRYVLTGTGRAQGLFALLFDWQGAARTEGLAVGGDPRPLSHSHEGSLNGRKRQTLVDWTGDDGPRARLEPPPDLEKVTPVPATSVPGTADPLTVLLTVLDGLKRTGRCEAEAKIWDGRRRYDLVVRHVGPEVLVADRPWSYAGPSVKCRLRIEPIGGFRRKASSWKAKGDTGERAVWLADLGGGRFIPVRAEIETAYGLVVGRLKPAGAQAEPAQRAEAGPGDGARPARQGMIRSD